MRFSDVWDRVKLLEGKSVELAVHGQIEVLAVDDEGLTRRTSKGHVRRIPIKSFRWTVARIEERGRLERLEVLAGVKRWESSGIVAILAATDLYEITLGKRVSIQVKPR